MDRKVFKHKGIIVSLDMVFIRNHNAEEKVDEIIKLHKKRIEIELQIQNLGSVSSTKRLVERWTENQFLLQDLYGLPRDVKFHRFWELPNCTCPKMDNEDGYPHISFVSSDCPLHS